MCMLFVYLNNGTDKNIPYKIVLISNRDEFWSRPTECAKFRGNNQQWIGGIDLEPGREGGTWLGMNKQGQIAVLLNILAKQELDKKGRGNLVTDFLHDDEVTCEKYLDRVMAEQDSYNPFQLILIDIREKPGQFHYLNNVDKDAESARMVLQQDRIAADNSAHSITSPWCKNQAGQKRFTDILQQYADPESKSLLIDQLVDLLNDKTQHFPDPQLQKQFRDVERKDEGCLIEQRSALCVFSPSIKYGTRTNTVILVDQDGNCDYIERTLEMPVNIEQPIWSTVKYTFRLECDDFMNQDKFQNN